MQKEHKDVIQKNFSSLVERTDLDSMVEALYEKGVFSERMIEPYRDLSITSRERKRLLYREITRRGPRAFAMLLEALQEMGYWDLVRSLNPNSNLQLPARQPIQPDPDDFISLVKRKNNNNEAAKLRPTTDAPVCVPIVNNNEPEAVINFEVNKSTSFFEDDVSKDSQLYRTRSRKRGVLVVFSYILFADIDTKRNGVNVDSAKLKHLFSEIGFKVLSYENLTLEQTRATLDGMSTVVAGYECVFVVVSSHGYNRSASSDTDIRCSDARVISLYAIIDYFNNRKLPNFIDRPKVFIFQVCRGDNEDFVHDPTSLTMPAGVSARVPAGVARDGVPEASSLASQHMAPPRELIHSEKPLYSNILIANSTLPGFVSRRDVEKGSWYIQAVCEVFAERAHDCDVDELFKLVDRRLQERFGRQTSSVDRWGFNNKLYLHPGLFE